MAIICYNWGYTPFSDIHIFRQTSIQLSAPTQEKSNSFLHSISGSPALLAIFRHVLLREIAGIKVPRSHKNYHKNYQLFIWVNYNISLTWIKATWGWFPLLTMIIVRSQWGRDEIYPDSWHICCLPATKHGSFAQGAAPRSPVFSPLLQELLVVLGPAPVDLRKINIDRLFGSFFWATHYLKIHRKKKKQSLDKNVWWSVLRGQD